MGRSNRSLWFEKQTCLSEKSEYVKEFSLHHYNHHDRLECLSMVLPKMTSQRTTAMAKNKEIKSRWYKWKLSKKLFDVVKESTKQIKREEKRACEK